MSSLPKALQDLIDALALLPGVGPRSAERYAYYLLKNDQHKSAKISVALESLHQNIKTCPKTFALIDYEHEVSPLYDGANRNKQVVALVADPFDIVAIEKTNEFTGKYHVLSGVLSPLDGVGPNDLNIDTLTIRVNSGNINELILALTPTTEGEATVAYLTHLYESKDIDITRIARGVPLGTQLEFIDQATLGRAMSGRRTIE